MHSTAHIYALLDEGGPRYIGQSINAEARRMWHWYNRRYDSGNMPLKYWLRSLDEPPQLLVLDEVPWVERYAHERDWTIFFRQIPGLEILNINDGITPGELTRARMSAAKTPEIRCRISERMKDVWAARRLSDTA